MKPIDLKAMLARGMEELTLKQQANSEAWGLGSEQRWDADLETGEISFKFSTGLVVTSPIQVVGTHNAKTDMWLWAWDNPSVRPELAEHARPARSLGQQYELP